jgi:hypothetical protein
MLQPEASAAFFVSWRPVGFSIITRIGWGSQGPLTRQLAITRVVAYLALGLQYYP